MLLGETSDVGEGCINVEMVRWLGVAITEL